MAFLIAGVPAAVVINVMLKRLFTYRLGTACTDHFVRADLTTNDMRNLSLAIAGRLLQVLRIQDRTGALVTVPVTDEGEWDGDSIQDWLRLHRGGLAHGWCEWRRSVPIL